MYPPISPPFCTCLRQLLLGSFVGRFASVACSFVRVFWFARDPLIGASSRREVQLLRRKLAAPPQTRRVAVSVSVSQSVSQFPDPDPDPDPTPTHRHGHGQDSVRTGHDSQHDNQNLCEILRFFPGLPFAISDLERKRWKLNGSACSSLQEGYVGKGKLRLKSRTKHSSFSRDFQVINFRPRCIYGP